MQTSLHVALLTEVVVLPELPCHLWIAAGTDAHPEDAEAPDGSRFQSQRAAAMAAGITLIG